jgi:hypothetical protein
VSSDVTIDLVRALIENMEGPSGDWDGWESLAMILEFPEGKFNEAHGYAYSPGGAISAVASDPWAVAPAVNAYTDSYYKPGEALPVQLLIQFDRTSGRYNVTFEDTDETRWKVTPRNFKELREELRPKFD